MQKIFVLLVGLVFCLAAVPANAATITYDFTDNSWSDLAGDGLTLSANGAMTWNNGDGIGIGDDEIGDGETLTVTFDTTVKVTKISFLDFFKKNDQAFETAEWSTDGSNWNLVTATNSGEPGSFTFLTNVNTDKLYFRGVAGPGDDADKDFSLASIETSAVPIPGAAWLLGSGLIGLVGIRRRFKKS